ncbi:lyase family protein [Nocardia flavorosea]|uniref:lyase family protein n=1 Tax=Nocardia flavorosea TaxID=53429 RepID=UPI003CC7F62F
MNQRPVSDGPGLTDPVAEVRRQLDEILAVGGRSAGSGRGHRADGSDPQRTRPPGPGGPRGAPAPGAGARRPPPGGGGGRVLVRPPPAGVPGSAVHKGATSQDILDNALLLLAQRTGAMIVDDLRAAADAAAELAHVHRDTPMAARTLGQQALPTTFGALSAGWCKALDRAAGSVTAALADLPVQFGGAAGTLAALYPHGPAVADALAAELGLAAQGIPWHTDRTPIAELATALGVAAGAVAKIATDIVTLSATEIGEVSEDAPGGSSAMPHKRNLVAAITARAAARRVPGLVADALGAMDHELQRAAGAWHAEWETVTDLLRLTGGAAHRLAQSLTGLHVHPEAMARNLAVTGGLLLAERVTAALSEHTDRARDIVTAAATANPPALDTDPAIIEHLGAHQVRDLLDPAGYLGHAADLVTRVLTERDSTHTDPG